MELINVARIAFAVSLLRMEDDISKVKNLDVSIFEDTK
jgi:hypothetical protein